MKQSQTLISIWIMDHVFVLRELDLDLIKLSSPKHCSPGFTLRTRCLLLFFSRLAWHVCFWADATPPRQSWRDSACILPKRAGPSNPGSSPVHGNMSKAPPPRLGHEENSILAKEPDRISIKIFNRGTQKTAGRKKSLTSVLGLTPF